MLHGTLLPGAWTGLHTDADGPCWSRSVSGAVRTGTSRRKAVSGLAAARRAVTRFSMSAGPVPSRTNSSGGRSGWRRRRSSTPGCWMVGRRPRDRGHVGVEAGVGGQFGTEALGPHGGAVDLDEGPQHRPALAADRVAPVVQEGVGAGGCSASDDAACRAPARGRGHGRRAEQRMNAKRAAFSRHPVRLCRHSTAKGRMGRPWSATISAPAWEVTGQAPEPAARDPRDRVSVYRDALVSLQLFEGGDDLICG